MNRYTVDWDRSGENALAWVYLKATDPAAVTRAQAAVDTLLETDPLLHAARMPEGLFRLRYGPLVVFFSVDEAARSVIVSGVGLIP